MTRNEILGEILQRWCYAYKEDVRSTFKELCKTDNLSRRKVWHSLYIEPELIFSGIDSVIYYLQELKKEGYTCLEEKWDGYSSFHINASKYEEENDDEYYSRLIDIIYQMILRKINLDMEAKNKAIKIAKLKAELKRLESE